MKTGIAQTTQMFFSFHTKILLGIFFDYGPTFDQG